MSTINAGSTTPTALTLTGNTDGTLGLATGGTTRMTIDGSGNVGIGTSIPGSFSAAGRQLVVGSGSGNQGITIYSGASGASSYGGLHFADGVVGTESYRGIVYYEHNTDNMQFWTAAAERMRINNAGRVGIATASPISTLTVAQASSGTPSLGSPLYYSGTFLNSFGGYGLGINVNSATGIVQMQSQRFDDIATAYDIALNPLGGNVGIGTASPSTGVHLNRASGNTYFRAQNGTANADFGVDSAGTGIVWNNSNYPLAFGTNNTERMRISSAGNVSIGTTASSLSGETFKFLLNQAGGTLLGLNNASNTNQTWAVLVLDSGLGAAGRFTLSQIVNGSTAGLGGGPQVPIIQCDPPTTANTTTRLFINAAGEVLTGGLTDNGAYNLQCNGTGVWGAGAYVNGSDARLKDDITTLNDGLNVVSQLRPVTFKYKPDYSKDQNVQTGFIAQELQAVLAGKEYVDGIVQAGPDHLNVAYQSLIPILTKAIQEQQAMIDELKAKVAALETK